MCSLESLPLLVLEEICDYLALGRNENGEDEGSIGAFSLVSRSCYHAAAAQRFYRIKLTLSDHIGLRDDLKTWDEILTRGNYFRHVRQLTLTYAGEKRLEARDRFDVDDSLKPAMIRHLKPIPTEGEDGNKNWQALSQLISRMHGLKDFVYALRYYLDPCILAAVHAVGCRLHIHHFNLKSLYQPKDRPSDIDPYDYVLATSPCLHSIVASCAQYTMDGLVDYHREAVLRMVAGAAPNLAHVWLSPQPLGMTLALQRAVRGSARPPWQGFFPSKEKDDNAASMGSLKSLVLHDGVSREDLVSWSHTTDLSKVRCLTLSFSWCNPRLYTTCRESLDTLVELVGRSQLASLRSLSLENWNNSGSRNYGEFPESLTEFLSCLGPLQSLHIPHVDYTLSEALFTAMSRHTLSPCCQTFYGTDGS